MTTLTRLYVKRLHEDAYMPERSHLTDAGLDMRALRGGVLPAGGRLTLETGVAVDIPPGFVGLLCSRSGLASTQGIAVLNAPGVIDSGYHGDVSVVLINTGRNAVQIKPGDKIAQLLIQEIALPSVVSLEEMGVEDFPFSERGTRGFGSTGQ